jgi:molybdopterin-biosynthesis enzyme MoeA-like protein
MVNAIKKIEINVSEGEVKAVRRFGLIVIGDEILSGRRQDKHMSKLIELLVERGLSLSWARYVELKLNYIQLRVS